MAKAMLGISAMNKIRRTYWLRPELVDGLEQLRDKLKYPPPLTTLVEDAIEALLIENKIKVERRR